MARPNRPSGKKFQSPRRGHRAEPRGRRDDRDGRRAAPRHDSRRKPPGRDGRSRGSENRAEGRGTAREGVLSVHPRGFGFVSGPGGDDVFVPPEGIGGALHGDRVVVAIVGRSARGAEGRIERIVARRSPRVAGTLRKRRKSAWLEPDDARLRGPIVLTTVPAEGKDGEAAVVAITRFPEGADENPEGELVAVLGASGDAQVEVEKILVREQVTEAHPEDAMREAEAIAARKTRLTVDNRVDLREVPLLTIDPADARDHDDAVYAETTNTGYRVWVAIADVSEYVQPGTALDAEAARRGCTIYLPDRAIPMLPSALAADLCSLLPDQERLCLCVIADLDKRGDVRRVELVEGLMRGAAMITYNSAARALGFSEEQPRSPQAEAFKRELRVLDEVARKLRRKRLKRGALDFDLPEPHVQLEERTGVPKAVTRRARDPGVKRCYQIVEELMILANELVAEWLGRKESPAVYRVHAKPDEQKLARLEAVCETVGVPFELEEMLEPRGLSRWLASVQDHPRKNVLEMLLLRSMKQAVYDVDNVGHFGLASKAYVHFTSPIRRYPDVEIHRAVKRLIRGERPDTSPEAVEALRGAALTSSTRERAAMDVEREVVDLYRALFMRDRLGSVAEGVVTAVTGGGVYVTLDDPFVDVLVRFESLGPDHYAPSEDDLRVVGVRSGDTIMIGDRLTVTIEDVSILRRTVFARRVVPAAVLDAMEHDQPFDRGERRSGGRNRARSKKTEDRGGRADEADRGRRSSRPPRSDRGKRRQRH